MTASAGAARASTVTVGWIGFLLVLAGGLVEGTALGLLQGRALTRPLGTRGRRAWLGVTLALAGVGWAVGSAPSTLAEDGATASPSSEPPLLLVLLGAALVGLALGALLGAAQSWVLAKQAAHPPRHPWRWIVGSALSWAVAMTVIFAGATTAGASWPWPVVVGYGALTGAVAGLGLGVVGAPFLLALDGPGVPHRAVLAWLRWRRRDAGDGVTGIGVMGSRTGHTYRFPVQAVTYAHGFVVCPGRPDTKSWWRNLDTPDGAPAAVEVLDAGRWRAATAVLLTPQDAGYQPTKDTYVARWPRAEMGGPLVVVSYQPNGTKVPIA